MTLQTVDAYRFATPLRQRRDTPGRRTAHVYAPKLDKSDDIKDKFYNELAQCLDSINAREKILLLGDFNARVRRDYEAWSGVLGSGHGVGNMNSNGQLLLSLCAQYEREISSTMFRLAAKHKTSWMHPRSKHWHLIDYAIVRKTVTMEKKPSTSGGKDNFSSTAELTANPGFQSSLSIAAKSDDKVYNPFEHRTVEHPNSVFGSILHLLKACLGSGILAMPAAFKNCGLLTGSIGTLLAGLVCTHTVHMLVRASQSICVEAKKPSMSFAETCGAVFTYGPKKLQKWGGFVKTLVDYSMALTYISVLCVYIVFIGSSFKEVLDVALPEYQLSIQTYCILTLVPLALICQIRNLKYLVPFSAIANVMLLIVFAITMYYIFVDLPSVSEREIVADISQWPLFFSTVIFAMEGIGVVMPVENEMAKPQKFLGCPGVLNVSMVIVITLYGIFGFFGYLQFGDDVKGSITLNLPQDSIVAQTATLLMAIVIFLSFTLQFYVPMEMITRLLKKRQSNSYENIIQVAIRITIVSITVAIAAAFPNLELVISFVGAVFFSTLGLLIPAVVDTVYHWDKGLGKFNYILWKNVIIGVIAIIALVSGAYVSILGMIEEFSSDNDTLDHNVTLSYT
ncbi:proton-coupled amino acid transporter-like protein acs [Aphomia sociella]